MGAALWLPAPWRGACVRGRAALAASAAGGRASGLLGAAARGTDLGVTHLLAMERGGGRLPKGTGGRDVAGLPPYAAEL